MRVRIHIPQRRRMVVLAFRSHDPELHDARVEKLLQKQYSWLAERGVSEAKAALAIHGAVLVLSGPGLRAEAEEERLPLEIVEYRAVKAAAEDIAKSYGVDARKAFRRIARILALYGE